LYIAKQVDMKPIIQNKANQVSELVEQLKTAKSFLVFEYLGLTGAKTTELRKKLHNAGAKMYVSKNNIFNRAISEAGISGIETLTGPCALIVSHGDEIIAFKEISNLMKDLKFIHYKQGLLDGNIVGIDKLATVASLPGKNDLLSMLCSALQGNLRNLMYGLKAVADTK
jgi:large subunit ribosomal protein L10